MASPQSMSSKSCGGKIPLDIAAYSAEMSSIMGETLFSVALALQ
jgi:hypothetical protein